MQTQPALSNIDPRLQLEDLQRQIAELEAYKAQREEQDMHLNWEPVDKPKGEAGRSGKNEKKPGYNLAKEMGISERHLGRIQKSMKFFMGKLGLPRGVAIDDPRYSQIISDIYSEMVKTFKEDFDNDRYTALWPLREILNAKLRNQRKTDLKAARKLAHEDAVELAQREGRPIPTLPTKPKPAPKKGKHDVKQESKPEVSPESSPQLGTSSSFSSHGTPALTSSAAFEDELEYVDADQSRVLPHQELWSLVGPMLRDAMLEGEYDLPAGFAEYTSLSNEDRESWEARDRELGEELEAGEPTRTWWMEALEERFSDPDDFEVVWQHFTSFYWEPVPEDDFSEDDVPAKQGDSPKRRIKDEDDDNDERPPAKKERFEDSSNPPPPSSLSRSLKPGAVKNNGSKPRPKPIPKATQPKKRSDLEDDPIDDEGRSSPPASPKFARPPNVAEPVDKGRGRAPPPGTSTRLARGTSKQT